MLRAIWLLILLGLGVWAALYLRQMGGIVEITVGNTFIGIPVWLGLLALVVGFVVLHGLLSAWKSLRGWPARIRARRAERHRRDGDAAVTRALVALAAGTPDQARLEIRRARGLLGDTPHTLLLTAEAERMAGRNDAANEAFRALAGREDGKFLGLRGLLRDAMQREDWPAAQRLAREAEAAQPGAAWVKEERAALALRTQDWREALALSPPDQLTGHRRAALALAAAMQDPETASSLEKQALSADPGFAPAALAVARRQVADGSPRRARSTLQAAWKVSPHPDIAEAYLADESDPLARVKAAESLTHENRTHPESRLILGRTALAAGLTGRARAELEALVNSGVADRRAYLAMVDMDAVELGDSAAGRAAEAKWLRAAAAAPPEPRWQCLNCGTVHRKWEPVCEACGTPGRIEWTGGVQKTGAVATT
ncbi:heme biosynthesis HemY N-terminal domain-containing protein [Roseomonas xinghualingensis]|uniref:heme biosynthesis HemY N-terminal domain-containing protein n=1 Tax=Roseomonas xinghualingensis TaxID=2986475 RepID=UPI0021F17D72|nr:heme biosynthesis HemY N-terminal domain-containing protein [Roseomonas sp. SXEYE001]MCV4207607.1 heme biosynthesis protein HemY [Roseomonas sp. SXEYE001]